MHDAVLGRMLSPDKYVQDGTNTQAYNRYSYVMNNQLKYTDPSGWLRLADVPQDVNADDNPRGGGAGGYIGKTDFNQWSNMSNWSANPALYSTYYNYSTGQYMNGTNEILWQQAISGAIVRAGNNAVTYNVGVYDWYKKYSDGHLEYTDTKYKLEKTGYTIDMSGAMSSLGGEDAGKQNINRIESNNNVIFLGDGGKNNLYEYYKNISKYNIRNQITIIGHGNYDRIGVDPQRGDHFAITDVDRFEAILSNYSQLWSCRDQQQIIVWSMCCANACTDGAIGMPLLYQMSYKYQNILFIGANTTVNYNSNGTISLANNGSWIMLLGGVKIGSFKP